jgi:hypothetical protein
MNHARVFYHLVRADFLERVRRYSFLLTLAFATYLAYGAGSGRIVLRLDDYRGVYNSAWIGSMMTLVSTTFLTLVGFYIVKNAILRDEQTRVGQILATTPMSRSFYTVAKGVSNFAVLSAMMAVLALAAVILQYARAEDPHIHLGTLLAPFLWVGLPAMAFTAALAVLFETLPILRGGLGNVIYFFTWGIILGLSIDRHFDDAAGFTVIGRNMQSALQALDPAYKNGLSLSINSGVQSPAKVFLWSGVAWTPQVMLHRLLWVAIALGLAVLAAAFFHRFDPAQEHHLWKPRPQTAPQENGAPLLEAPAASPGLASHLTSIARARGQTRFLHLVTSELRLMLKGHRWWWYVVAAGLCVAQLVSPDLEARQGTWLVAWLGPVLVWSQMGAREARYATQSLIFSSERALYRQLPAVWTAGVIVAVLTGGGMGIRLLLAGDARAFSAWAAGALFIPSLALALGVWSGTSKTFEALYTVWWYLAANHTPGMDFMGTTAASTNTHLYFLAAAALTAASYMGRRVRLGYA